MLRRFLIAATLAAVAVAGAGAGAGAQTTVNSSSSSNATVRPAGPRPGTSGTGFFNVEGSGNAANASFGVIDFVVPATSVGAITSLSIRLVESNAGFTAPGTLNFYVSNNTTTSISNAAGASPLVYQPTPASGPNGVGTQLDTLFLLGSGAFTTTGNVNSGQVDTFTFTPDASTSAYLQGQLASGGVVRIVAAEAVNNPSLAATFAGSTNATAASQPLLTINAAPVPEPATVLAMSSLALAGVGALRRRRERASTVA